MRELGWRSVFVLLGLPALVESLGSLASLDVHFLMTAAAFVSVFIGHQREGAALLLLFVGAELAQDLLSQRARASLDALNALVPERARRVADAAETLAVSGEGIDVLAGELRPGDLILVRAGEVVPVDGQIVDGTSQVRQDHLTGEPLPVVVARGDEVMSGALNVDGALLVRVLRPADESTLQKIARLTAAASASRPQLVTFLDAVAKRWSYAVVLSTAALAAVPPLLFNAPVGASVYRALNWLIVASPCALMLASPLVYVAALSVASTNGILLKSGRALDALALANGVAFDKTGTLTTGWPTLVRVEELAAAGGRASAAAPGSRQQALAAAGALGRLSLHPVSQALAAVAPLDLIATVEGHHAVAGSGVLGTITFDGSFAGSYDAALGSPAFVAEHLAAGGVAGASLLAAAVRRVARGEGERDQNFRQSDGCVVAILGLRPRAGAPEGTAPVAWALYLQDRLKASAPLVLEELSRRGLPLSMLTGDCEANAASVVRQLRGLCAFEKVYADLRPQDKLEKVRELDAQLKAQAASSTSWSGRLWRALGVSSGGLVMVGDGVNDGPALAAATVGISLASQADRSLSASAVEGSDIVVLRQATDPDGEEDLLRVAWFMDVSRAAERLLLQNVTLAVLSIVGGAAMAVSSRLPLWLGVVVHEGTTMIVALNSLRLFSQLGMFKRGPLVQRRKRPRP